MIYLNAATLCVVLLLAHSVAIAHYGDEANEPFREELYANFGPAEYEAIRARSSDVVPDARAEITGHHFGVAEVGPGAGDHDPVETEQHAADLLLTAFHEGVQAFLHRVAAYP